MSNIDITFDVFFDTPTGKDPDKFSATLRDYHRQLWSKSLPNGGVLELDENIPYVPVSYTHLTLPTIYSV